MKEKIIKIAMMYPHLFPWEERLKREGIIIDNQGLTSILKEAGLDEEETRRRALWQMEELIYINAAKCSGKQDLKDRVYRQIDKEKRSWIRPPEDAYITLAVRKDLWSDEKIAVYRQVIGGNISRYKDETYKKMIENWFADIGLLYFVSQGGSSPDEDEVVNKTAAMLKEKLNTNEDLTEVAVRRAKLQGFNLRRVLRMGENELSLKGRELGELIYGRDAKLPEDRQESQGEELFDDLMKMVDDIPGGETTAEFVNEEDGKDKGAALDNVISPIKEELTALDKELHSRETVSDEGTLPKEVAPSPHKDNKPLLDKTLKELLAQEGYEALRREDLQDDNLVRFLKSLVDPSEGAVLSQLYASYRSLDDSDESNVKAALSDFFSQLMASGLIPAEDDYTVGDSIRADSSRLLKSYRTTVPMGKNHFNAVVKYPAWELNGKTIMVPIICPTIKKKEGEE